MKIGAHVSISGGVENAPLNALAIGADAFAMFVKNQRQWSAKPLSPTNIEKFKQNLQKSKILPKYVLVHSSYLINLGHPLKENREKSINAFIDEIDRLNLLGLELLNFHPGSYLKEISIDECLKNISNSINLAISKTQNVKLVIENTAGQGSNLGYSFEHLAYLIDKCEDKSRIGVCIDTCHTFAAGYDLKENYQNVMKEFEKIVGYNYLAGMHINDSKSTLGSKKDRHESLGVGTLGMKTFENIIKDKKIGDIPLILETPNEEIWPKEIATLKEMIKEFND